MIIDEIPSKALRACYLLQDYRSTNGFAELLFTQDQGNLIIQSLSDNKMVQVVVYDKAIEGGHLCGFGKRFRVNLYTMPPASGTSTINTDNKTCLYRGTRGKKKMAHCIVSKAKTKHVVPYIEYKKKQERFDAMGQDCTIVQPKTLGLLASVFSGLEIRLSMSKTFCRANGSSEMVQATYTDERFRIHFLEINKV